MLIKHAEGTKIAEFKVKTMSEGKILPLLMSMGILLLSSMEVEWKCLQCCMQLYDCFEIVNGVKWRHLGHF